MKMYFLSGLGADNRAFKFLSLPKNIEPVYINWLTPLKDENIKTYAKRISLVIDDSVPFMLTGLSFGGIIAGEIAQIKTPDKLILISSIIRRTELPLHYNIVRLLKGMGINIIRPLKKGNKLLYWLFGTGSLRDKRLLDEILADTDASFADWAVTQLLVWTGTTASPAVRVHGSKDRIFPVTNFVPDHLIDGGGHLMVVTHADDISAILAKEIQQSLL